MSKKISYRPKTPYTGKLPEGTVKRGDEGTDVKRVEKFLNWCLGYHLETDGIAGDNTVDAIKDFEKTYGLKIDGVFGPANKKKAKEIIADHKDDKSEVKPKPAETEDPLQPWYDAMEKQFEWSKDQNYKFVTPTIKSSKKNGTCITFPAVSLQRLGLLPSGGYFYFHPQHKRISGKSAEYVKKHTELFKLSYPNKTIKELHKEGKIKKGDIVGFGNPAYHTMVYMGMKDGEPRFNTMGHKRGLKVKYPSYADRKVNMLVRIKKTSK